MNRRQAQKDWFAIARTPTWLGRLLVALALAAAFALLGQWQLGRALPQTTASPSVSANPSGNANPTPSASAGAEGASVDLKTFTVSLNASNFAVIGERVQPGRGSGFWLVTNSQIKVAAEPADVGRDLTIAWGWASTSEQAKRALADLSNETFAAEVHVVNGVLAETEPPLPSHADQPNLFDSLSLAQLVNVYEPVQERNTFERFLILQPTAQSTPAPEGLETIVLTSAPSTPLENVNWLSAFYAIEWSVFAGFAVFMWWRLVEDERLRRKADAELTATNPES
ncbi:MAG: hypothetical protein RL196_1218 [Actinomycetota bacterium]|jgi:cytochrome oxidase assembly protein ShyY1